jgi:hypothetical protein
MLLENFVKLEYFQPLKDKTSYHLIKLLEATLFMSNNFLNPPSILEIRQQIESNRDKFF